jgi:hypothetical protein
VRVMNALPVREGETLPISFDPADLHVFDPASHLAISGGTT